MNDINEIAADAAQDRGTAEGGSAQDNDSMNLAGSSHSRRFDVLEGQVFRDTRPDEIRRVQSQVAKARKREGSKIKSLPQHVHVRVDRVLGDKIVVISVEDPSAESHAVDRSWIGEMVQTRAWIPVDREPVAMVRLGDNVTPAQRRGRNLNKDIIAHPVALGDQYLDHKLFAEAVLKAATEHDVDPGTVRRLFRRWLQGGRSAYALTARWLRGAENPDGRRRRVLCKAEVRAGVSKPKFGRPRSDGTTPFQVTAFDVAKCVAGASKYYHTPDGGNWKRAYLLTLAEHYLEIDADSAVPVEEQLKKYTPDSYPSLFQFRYWAKTDHMVVANLKKRHGQKKFDLEFRSLKSRTELDVSGPAARYQIDATRVDVVCVHQLTRRPIGRLTLYLVVDTWSRMIVGYHITTANPGYNAAVLAVLSCAMNKVELAARHGKKIPANAWPVQCLPEMIVGDSELASLAHHALAEAGIVQVRIAPAYRADLKGLVESMFASLNKSTVHHLPGKSDGARYRCQGNPDVLAVLDVRQLNRVVIDWILQRNARVLPDYALTEEMMAAGITAATPNLLWDFGTANIGGARRVWDLDILKRICLPKAKAKMGQRGVEHAGLFYEPQNAIDLPNFPTWKVKGAVPDVEFVVTYHPEDVNEVWLHWGERRVPMMLTEESSRYRGWTTADLEAFYDDADAARLLLDATNLPSTALLEQAKLREVEAGTALTKAARGTTAERRLEKVDKAAERRSQSRLSSKGGRNSGARVPAAAAATLVEKLDAELVAQLKTQRPAAN